MPLQPPPPYEHDHENEVVLFGQTNFRNQMRKFGIKTDDRRRHVYVIGKTGMGKSTLLENMVLADMYAGHGLAYIDPHGDTAEKFLDFVPPHRINDVVYFNPADMEYPIGFNILETVDESQKHLVAAGLMGVFKKIWPDVWSSRMEYILLNTIMALLDFPGSTLLGINRLLSDEEFRMRVVSLIQDPVVKTFWVKEFAAFSEKYRTEAVAPLQNKVGQFLSATVIRNIVAQVKSTINMRQIMDQRKIFIVNLSKGRIGEENSRLLGAMVITRLQLTAMERVDMPERDRQDFYLYVDEFQNFATESFANILSEARKYRLSLIVAHQYIEQLDEMVRAAIFGNVGTIVAFRVGAADAAFMEGEFMPRFTPEDLVNLKKYEVYLKLMIDGASSEPFSAATLPPIAENTGSREKVVRVSRERYATPRKVIEEKVIKWSGFGTTDTGVKLTTEDEDEEQAAIEAKIAELAASSPDVGEYAKPADGGGFGGKKKQMAPKKPLFEVPCAICGKISELTFEPDWSKPWFCKEHLEQKQNGMISKAQLSKLQPAGVVMGRPGFAAAPSAGPTSAPAPKPSTPPAPSAAPKPPVPKTPAPPPKPAAQAPAAPKAAVPSPSTATKPPAPAASSAPVVAAAAVAAAVPAAVPASPVEAVQPPAPAAPVPKPPAPATPAAPAVPPAKPAAPQQQNQQPKVPTHKDPISKKMSKTPPPPKIGGPAPAKPQAPVGQPVSLSSLPSREGMEKRSDRFAKGAAQKIAAMKDKQATKPAAPKPAPKPTLAAAAEEVAGIPSKAHKPRIVTESAAPVAPPQPTAAPKADRTMEPLGEPPAPRVREISFLDSLAEADKRAHEKMVGGSHGHMPSVPATQTPPPSAPPAQPPAQPKPPAQPPQDQAQDKADDEGWLPNQVIKFD